MPYAAITYDVKPGHEDEIAELFANFQRADTPVLRNEAGEEVGRLVGTAVFIRGGTLVRFIHYEGDFIAVAKHMGQQKGVHLIEDKLQEITWDEWFEKFDERKLALLHQETTASGEKSNFNKIISRENARSA